MKLIQHLLLFAETLGFSLRLWWWKRFGKPEQVKKQFSKELFHYNGRPTRYLHSIVFTNPDKNNRKMNEEIWHYYRQFKGHWVTIRTQTALN